MLSTSGYRLVTSERGEVSFEYVIVVFLVIVAVIAAFPGTTTGISATLTTGLTVINTVVTG